MYSKTLPVRESEEIKDSSLYFSHLLSCISPIVTFDMQFMIRFANSSFEKEFGLRSSVSDRINLIDVLRLRGADKKKISAMIHNMEYTQESEFKSGKKIFGFNMFMIHDHKGMILKDITEKKKLESRVKKLHSQLLELQEKERQKIAGELHDGIGQTILAAKLNLVSYFQAPEQRQDKFQQGIHLIDQVSQELREMYTKLYPSVLSDLGLKAAINSFIKSYIPEGIDYVGYFDLPMQIDHKIEVNLYRMTQEMISNAIKHSGANEISLELVLKKGSIIYIFNDNGCGFLMKDIQLRQKGFGLENIKRRVDDMDGQLQITSGKSGTSIQIEIPIRQHEKR